MDVSGPDIATDGQTEPTSASEGSAPVTITEATTSDGTSTTMCEASATCTDPVAADPTSSEYCDPSDAPASERGASQVRSSREGSAITNPSPLSGSATRNDNWS